MIYRLLAEALLVVHLGYVLFVVFGGFLAARQRWPLGAPPRRDLGNARCVRRCEQGRLKCKRAPGG